MSDLPSLPFKKVLADYGNGYHISGYTEEQLKTYARAAIASRDEEITRLRSLLAEASSTINRKCEAYDFMSDEDGELLSRIDAALKEKE